MVQVPIVIFDGAGVSLREPLRAVMNLDNIKIIEKQ
tara:strand:+ start:1161 stop:1268 length:108 start_codon:yes stop_codon:yes gene_type:complete